jgi:hypothetical protein
MKTLILASLAILGSTAFAAENTGITGMYTSKANYYCAVNRENPKQKGTYDQPVFYGPVLAKDSSDQIVLTKKGELVLADLESLPPAQVLRLSGSALISFSVTEVKEVKSDEHRSLSIGVSVFPNLSKNQTTENTPKALASGYHRGQVMLIYDALKLSIICMHKTALTRN